MKSFFEKIQNESKANKKLFARTALIENVTEDLMLAMEDLEISKTQLARKLGKSKSYISQILNGSRNMTLNSLSDLCFELNIEPKIQIIEENQKMDWKEFHDAEINCWTKEDVSNVNIQAKTLSRRVIEITEHPEHRYHKVAA